MLIVVRQVQVSWHQITSFIPELITSRKIGKNETPNSKPGTLNFESANPG